MYNPRRIFSVPFSTKDMFVDALMNVIFVFACCAGVNFFLVNSPEQTNQFFFSFLLFVPAVLMFFIRRLRLRFLFMFILHLIPALLPILLIKYIAAENVFVMTLASMMIMIYSFRFSFRNKREYGSASLVVGCVLVHIGLLLALTLRGMNQLYPYVLAEALFCICVYLAVRQMVRFQKSFDHYLLSPTQPAKKIYANNVRVILLLFLAALIIIPISVIFPYDYPLRLLKSIVSGMIAGILVLLSLGDESEAVAPEPTEITDGTGEVVNTSAPTVLPEYIGQILDFIVFMITVTIFIYAAYKIYHFVRRYILSNYRKQDRNVLHNQNANVTDEVISIRKNRNRGSKNTRIFGAGEERKIRKLYYSTIKKQIRKGAQVTKASTAEEIKEAVHAGTGEDISELTRAYEKIRYGFPHAPQK